MKLNKTLKKIRKEAKLTQQALGDKIGVSRETINAIENRHNAYDVLTLKTISLWCHNCIAQPDDELLYGGLFDSIKEFIFER